MRLILWGYLALVCFSLAGLGVVAQTGHEVKVADATFVDWFLAATVCVGFGAGCLALMRCATIADEALGRRKAIRRRLREIRAFKR